MISRIRLKQGQKRALKQFKRYHGDPDRHAAGDDGWPQSQEDVERFRSSKLGIYRKTRTLCSHPFCCGNPRRLGAITRQEARNLAAWQEELERYGMRGTGKIKLA
ncbi:MAG: hypothetical protein KQJ78_14175 [Deltaproteobacteria bacterium]|nr:hypothetical protein [Deltaproteobacteria bacterium]